MPVIFAANYEKVVKAQTRFRPKYPRTSLCQVWYYKCASDQARRDNVVRWDCAFLAHLLQLQEQAGTYLNEFSLLRAELGCWAS